MATSGLYGNSSESIGLYGNTNVFGGTYFQWFIFQQNNDQPVTPTGGTWDFTTNTGTPPTGWTTVVASVAVNPVWFSTGFVDSRNPTVIVWSVPSLLTSSNSIYATAYSQTFTGNGTQTAFTLSSSPVTVNNTDVSINGVVQVPGVDYTVNSVTLTTTTPVINGAVMLVKYKQSLPNSYYGAASNVQFTPVGALTSTNVQSAIAEVVTDLALSSGASTVGYLPTGTGAVATTVQTKLRESVSVLDFGADPTGITDSAAAIQNAINAVSLAGGGTVYVPAGIYKITTTIYLSKTMSGSYYNPVQLIGAGRMSGNKTGGTILNHTGSGIAVWVGDYTNNVTATPYNSYYFSVRDISVIGNASTTIGFRFRQCYQLRLDNVTFNGTNGSSCTGMVFEACVEGLFNLLDIQFAGTTAGTKCINVTQSCNTALPLTASSQGLASTSSTFLGGYFHYAYQGASVYGNSVTFQNSKWETLVYGVEDASGGYQNTYIQNYWENVQGYGISVYSSDAANPAGNINIIGGFANRYDQAGSDMTGYTGANAFLKLYNCNNVKMQGTQILQGVSLYSSVYDAGGPTGPNQNIYVESNAGSLTPFATRYTAAGATGITGATLYTVSGTATVLVTKTSHGMVKGQVLDLSGFNSTTLGLTVNRPYCVVSSVSDASNFYITYPINATATASSTGGTIKYYTGGKLTNSGLPTSTILTDCEYQTYVFQATQASAGTNVTMYCNGTPFVIIPYDYYIKSYNLTVDNPDVTSVSTYAYINSRDSVSSRYDTITNLISSDISPVGDYYTNGLASIKQQAGQGLTVTLYDNGGSGATYPRHFTVEVVIANTLKAPT